MAPVFQLDGCESEVFGKIEMAAKRVRNIAVGFAEDHQHLDIVRNRAAGSALGFGNTQGADLRLFDEGEDIVRKFPLAFPAGGILCRNSRNVPGPGQNLVTARYAGIVGGGCLQFRSGHCGFP